MARGGRESSVEKGRMESMETYKYVSGRAKSGPVNFEKPAYSKPKVSRTPKSAGRP